MVLLQEIKNFTKVEPYHPDALKYIIYTSIGDGPELLKGSDVHLLDDTGLPK